MVLCERENLETMTNTEPLVYDKSKVIEKYIIEQIKDFNLDQQCSFFQILRDYAKDEVKDIFAIDEFKRNWDKKLKSDTTIARGRSELAIYGKDNNE